MSGRAVRQTCMRLVHRRDLDWGSRPGHLPESEREWGHPGSHEENSVFLGKEWDVSNDPKIRARKFQELTGYVNRVRNHSHTRQHLELQAREEETSKERERDIEGQIGSRTKGLGQGNAGYIYRVGESLVLWYEWSRDEWKLPPTDPEINEFTCNIYQWAEWSPAVGSYRGTHTHSASQR